MEGVPPPCNEDDVNLTSNQFDFQSPEDSFNISEFLSSPPKVPGNQSSILCNDQDGQNMVVDNNVINDSIQQTTQFPPSFPQTMVPLYQLNSNLFDAQCVNPMLPGPSIPLRDQQWTNYPLPMSNQVPAMLPGPQPPINQWHQNSNIPEPQPGTGYMTPNATTSQHGGFNQPGPSFPSPRIQFLSNQGQDDQAAVIPDIDNMQQENFVPRNSGNSTRLPPEVPDNQSSISSRINQNEPNWPQTPSRYLPHPNLSNPRCANPMLPGPSMPLRDQQWTNYQLPMRNQVPAMLPGPQPPLNQWHQYSNIHQPQPGHAYMTPNATTSEHGGFIQPGPSFPAPRSQYFSNQGQVDPAAVIPNIDNVQQENFVPGSQMDNLQVRGLQNQTAMPNASKPGLDTSLQSQNRGLNTQQVEMGGSNDSFRNYVEERADGSMKCKFCPHTYATKTSISRIKWHLSREEGHGVSICRGVAKEVQEAAWKAMCGGNKRHKITASSINDMANGHEAKFIEEIIKDVRNKLYRKYLYIPEHLVGMDRLAMDRLARNIFYFLSTATDDVRIVGIHGMPEIGKTTIAKVVFNQLYYRFEGSCFLSDIHEMSKLLNGLVPLQKQLLHDILKQDVANINCVDRGKVLIKERLRRKRVLVVADDVAHLDQLNALMGDRSWFGPGSRVIFTTRDSSLLREADQSY